MALLAFGVIRDGVAIAQANGRVERQTLALLREREPQGGDGGRFAADQPPAALLAYALEQTRAAAGQLAGEERAAALAVAADLLAVPLATRPIWGEARVVETLLADEARDDSRAAAAFRRSYEDAPFLRSAAAWRIARGFRRWNTLDGSIREAVLREALTLALFDPAERRLVFGLARSTPAYPSFTERWRALRAEPEAAID